MIVLASFLMLFDGIVVIMKKVSPRREIDCEYFEFVGCEAAKQVLPCRVIGDVGVPCLEGADGGRRLSGGPACRREQGADQEQDAWLHHPLAVTRSAAPSPVYPPR